jgi:hypothetical protein
MMVTIMSLDYISLGRLSVISLPTDKKRSWGRGGEGGIGK